MKKQVEDFLSFGRIVGAALVIVGFVFLSVLLGDRARTAGYPIWIVVLIYLAGAFLGLWQGWLSLRRFWRRDD